MTTTTESRPGLSDKTARDLMSKPVAFLSQDATFDEAVALLIDRNVSVAPVTGKLGEPVGVLSAMDLLIHVRESNPTGRIAPATVAHLMTPTVFSVPPETPAAEVIQDMLRSKVHHLFVLEPDGKIKGVISANDVLQHIKKDEG